MQEGLENTKTVSGLQYDLARRADQPPGHGVRTELVRIREFLFKVPIGASGQHIVVEQSAHSRGATIVLASSTGPLVVVALPAEHIYHALGEAGDFERDRVTAVHVAARAVTAIVRVAAGFASVTDQLDMRVQKGGRRRSRRPGGSFCAFGGLRIRITSWSSRARYIRDSHVHYLPLGCIN